MPVVHTLMPRRDGLVPFEGSRPSRAQRWKTLNSEGERRVLEVGLDFATPESDFGASVQLAHETRFVELFEHYTVWPRSIRTD